MLVEFYDVRWPILRDAAAMHDISVAWISYEPALGPLNIWPNDHGVPDWIICGGESGAKRREFKREWASRLRNQCAGHGVKFFMKQMSALSAGEGKRLIPRELMIQEFPLITA